jgi:secreted trypsin-like serine protease
MSPSVFALVLAIATLLPASHSFAQISLSISRDQLANARSESGPFQNSTTTGDERAVSSVGGGERSQCTAYGRPSAAHAEAVSRVLSALPTGASVDLRAQSYANGAHFRTCNGCLANQCLGNHGNDRYAMASATTTVIARAEINSEEKEFAYILSVGLSGSRGAVSLTVQGYDGVDLKPTTDDKSKFILTEALRRAVIRVSATAVSRDQGGCCSSEQVSAGLLTVSVERAPRQESLFKARPYIALGVPTKGFPNVVAIGIGDEMHCSGTFVGTKTIITAAHCIYGFEDKIRAGRFNVRTGESFHRPEKIFKVTSGEYANDRSNGFVFNQKTYEDDVGILYLDSNPDLKPAVMHFGSPKWDDIVANKTSVTIVGYGYNMIDGDMVGEGRKRTASIIIDDVNNRSIMFKTSKPNTCVGDSGGPTFFETLEGDKLIFSAITSIGDDDCTQGRNSRLDAYKSWIDARIQ